MEKKFFDSETKEQFKVMIFLLIIVCVLFTLCYMLSAKSSDKAANSSAQSSQASSKAAVTSLEGVGSEKETTSSKSGETESSQVKVQPAPKLDGTQKAIKLDNNDIHKGSLILVNKDYPSYVDGEDAVSLYDYKTSTYTVADTDVLINSSIVDTTNKMFDDYYAVYGESDIYIACAYRSYNTQKSLYENELDSDPDSGENLVAPPGYSDHQTGYVFDLDHYNATNTGIGFDGTGNDEWFLNNCADYGFIVRYPEDKVDITKYYYEPWHYRYVGIPHAIYMKQNNLCLEEYIEKIKNNTKDNPLTVSANDGTTWSMWYEKAYEDGDVTQIAVPKDCEYEISGNNVDGFIVTVSSTAVHEDKAEDMSESE